MDFYPELERLCSEKTCILGIGNYIKSDDAVGLYLADALQSASSDTLTVINAEDVPENYVFSIAGGDCRNVLVMDAVSSNTAPGTVYFGTLSDFNERNSNFSTHKLSLMLCGDILEKHHKQVYLLGIEAADTDFGMQLTPAVKESADTILDILSRFTSNHKELVYEL